MRRGILAALAVACGLAVAACGGGDGSNNTYYQRGAAFAKAEEHLYMPGADIGSGQVNTPQFWCEHNAGLSMGGFPA